jgi:hypothetical protein
MALKISYDIELTLLDSQDDKSGYDHCLQNWVIDLSNIVIEIAPLLPSSPFSPHIQNRSEA